MNKIIVSLISIFAFLLTAFANNEKADKYPDDIFALKGKRIILIDDKVVWLSNLIHGGSLSYTSTKDVFFNHDAFSKSKFNKKNLYKKDIVGKELLVTGIELNKNKNLLVKFIDTNDSLAMYIPEKQDPYKRYSTDSYANPHGIIDFRYYDYEEYRYLKLNQRETFYFKGYNKPYTITEINLIDSLSYIKYKDENGDVSIRNILPYSIYIDIKEGESRNYFKYSFESDENYYLQSFISDIAFENDLIEDYKKHSDMSYISSIKDKFVTKEVFVSQNGWNDFYICDSITIRNIGTKSPEYKYVMCLSSANGNRYLAIDSNNMNSIVDGKQKREEVLREKEAAKKRAEEEAAAEERRAIEEAKELQTHKNNLINKYGKENADLILDGQVRIGFTKEMCIEAWGEPYDINRTITSNCVYEQWVYNLDCYLYFEGNILTTIQN